MKNAIRIILIVAIYLIGYYSGGFAQDIYLTTNNEVAGRLVHHSALQQDDKSDTENNYTMFNRGYKVHLGLGFCSGTGEYNRDRLKIDLINSYQLNQNASIGVGFGVRHFVGKYIGAVQVLPVYLSLTGNTSDQSPIYVTTQIGLSTEADYIFEYPGIYFSFGSGSYFHLAKHFSLKVGVSFEHTKIYNQYMDFSSYYRLWIREYREINAICFDVGITFN